ncbi:armadillo-type protein, partial [Ochromonadaceae sp. CCMP2298]
LRAGELQPKIWAARALCNMAQCDQSRAVILNAEAVVLLLSLLRSGGVEAMTAAAEALGNLSHQAHVTQSAIARDEGAVDRLLSLLRHGSSFAKAAAATLLGNIAPHVGEDVLRSGAVTALVALMRDGEIDEHRMAAA